MNSNDDPEARYELRLSLRRPWFLPVDVAERPDPCLMRAIIGRNNLGRRLELGRVQARKVHSDQCRSIKQARIQRSASNRRSIRSTFAMDHSVYGAAAGLRSVQKGSPAPDCHCRCARPRTVRPGSGVGRTGRKRTSSKWSARGGFGHQRGADAGAHQAEHGMDLAE